MILGIYSDLHANKPALDAMQEKVGDKIDQWISLGDSVGLYPEVNEVLNWQNANNVMYIKGDHEEALINNKELPESFTASESIKNQFKIISADNLKKLSRLPSKLCLNFNKVKICATHFLSPKSHSSKTKYTLDINTLENNYSNYDFVFFGHTHLPTVLYSRKTIFINPGSAGFPIDIERKCSMVIFNTKKKSFDLVRFDYDKNKLIKNIKMSGYNHKLIDYILNNHRWV